MIRKATLEDLVAVVHLAEQAYQESPYYSRFTFNRDYILQYFPLALRMKNYFVRIVEVDGKVVGAMGGFIMPPLYGQEPLAYDAGLFLLPEYRGGMTAVKLIREFEQWAKEMGAKEVHLEVSTEINTDRTIQFYRKLGYRSHSPITVKEL